MNGDRTLFVLNECNRLITTVTALDSGATRHVSEVILNPPLPTLRY